MSDDLPGNARHFIDLARLGRTDGWAAAWALGRILLYLVLGVIVASVVLGLVSLRVPGTLEALNGTATGSSGLLVELSVVGTIFLVLLWGLRDAVVKTYRRPFLTLVSAEGRIDWRRLLAGACAWLAAAVIALPLAYGLQALLSAPAVAASAAPPIDWRSLAETLPLAVLTGIVIVPLQAGTEELLFRGWLTQALGQAVRGPILLAFMVAILFAIVHGLGAGLLAPLYFMVASLALSAVSLADGRLELSIGIHVTQNLFVLLVVAPFFETGHQPSLLAGGGSPIGSADIAAALVQWVLVYLLTRWQLFRHLFGIAR